MEGIIVLGTCLIDSKLFRGGWLQQRMLIPLVKTDDTHIVCELCYIEKLIVSTRMDTQNSNPSIAHVSKSGVELILTLLVE